MGITLLTIRQVSESSDALESGARSESRLFESRRRNGIPIRRNSETATMARADAGAGALARASAGDRARREARGEVLADLRGGCKNKRRMTGSSISALADRANDGGILARKKMRSPTIVDLRRGVNMRRLDDGGPVPRTASSSCRAARLPRGLASPSATRSKISDQHTRLAECHTPEFPRSVLSRLPGPGAVSRGGGGEGGGGTRL